LDSAVVFLAVGITSAKKEKNYRNTVCISIGTSWSSRMQPFGLLNSRNLYKWQVILVPFGGICLYLQGFESTITRTAGGLDFAAIGGIRQGREGPLSLKTTR
jgi:hypothetical protein